MSRRRAFQAGFVLPQPGLRPAPRLRLCYWRQDGINRQTRAFYGARRCAAAYWRRADAAGVAVAARRTLLSALACKAGDLSIVKGSMPSSALRSTFESKPRKSGAGPISNRCVKLIAVVTLPGT